MSHSIPHPSSRGPSRPCSTSYFARLAVLVATAACLAGAAATWAQTGGSEQAINSTTADHQRWPAVDMDDDGAFVVVWQDESGLDGSNAAIAAQRFDSSGSALGSEQVLNADTAQSQVRPAVAMTGDGGFIAVWDEFDNSGGGPTRQVVGRRFDSSGSPLGGDFAVSDGAPGSGPSSHARVAVARDLGFSTGGGSVLDSFAVVWQRYEDSGRRNVYARRFDSSGSAVGSAFRVNTTTSQDQERPDVAMAEDGSFVVVWDSYAQDEVRGVYAQRYDTSGSAVGSEFRVHQRTDDGQCCASIAPLENGAGYAIVYEGDQQDGDGRGVFARFLGSSGTFSATEIQVNVTTADHQGYPRVSTADDGEVVVAWQSAGQDGDGRGVYARLVSASGTAVGSEIQLPVTTSGHQDLPAVAKHEDDFIAVWRTYEQDGDGFGIAGRLFTSP